MGETNQGRHLSKTLYKNTGDTNQGQHLSKNPGQNKGETNQGQHLSKNPGQNKGETNQGQHLSKNPGQNKGETNQGRHLLKNPGQNKGDKKWGQHLSKTLDKTKGKQIRSGVKPLKKTLDKTKGKQIRVKPLKRHWTKQGGRKSGANVNKGEIEKSQWINQVPLGQIWLHNMKSLLTWECFVAIYLTAFDSDQHTTTPANIPPPRPNMFLAFTIILCTAKLQTWSKLVVCWNDTFSAQIWILSMVYRCQSLAAPSCSPNLNSSYEWPKYV